MESYADLMFTKEVLEAQEADGSAGLYDSRYEGKRGEELGENEKAFLTSRNSIYIASVNSDGWPYVQHRGGPVGFIKVLGPHRIAFADYRGNRQLITKGNLKTDDRVSVFAMDYPRKARLKLQGHATLMNATEAPAGLAGQLFTEGQGMVQRLMVIRIAAWDWNCPQYITPRLDTAEIAARIGPELERLERENAELKAELAELRNKS